MLPQLILLPLLLLFPTLTLCSSAPRPSNTPICDFYALSILGSNTAATQSLLMTLIINTVVLGNYTTPNTGVFVNGIAKPGVYDGTDVELLKYFTGELESTNAGGDTGVSKLFLDDGGAVSLGMNMSSFGKSSVQFHLLTDICQYFGTLLGCSLQGVPEFPAYTGRTSMYEVHRFMDLDLAAMSFFVQQCMLSSLSLGFSPTDAQIFSSLLNTLFNTRCSPPVSVPGITAAKAEFQSCCVAENCPLDPKGHCDVYPLEGIAFEPRNVSEVVNASGTATGTGMGSPNATGYVAASGGVEGIGGNGVGFGVLLTVVVGFVAPVLAFVC